MPAVNAHYYHYHCSGNRMEGKAEYVLPTGTKYIGELKDGM